MGLPVRGLLDLCQAGALWPADQFQDLCALALRAGLAGFLGGRSGLGRFLTGLGFLLRRGGRGFGFLGGFLALGRVLLLAAFLEEAFSGATFAPWSATVAVSSVVVATVFMVVNPFCASRMTIHHSGCPEKQGERWLSRKNLPEALGGLWVSFAAVRSGRAMT
jgi:hypothetical protein